ncbi:carbohydrate ABC transporter permease [Desulfospira joergensenii]|uniref:carbohydrate ABC transporter permease n=1 Tax=Desulfospira joergensenii TaxID=53329 RepID=UPI0003B6B4E5|nr:sugar ABC transporter permease [Desulfospira joergensenii]
MGFRIKGPWGTDPVPYGFLAPAVIIVFGVLIYPVSYAIFFSLTDKTMAVQDYHFVGMENYRNLMGDSNFWRAFGHSIVFAGVTGALNLFLGFGMALALNRRFRMRGLFHTVLLMPWVIPAIVTGLIFRWMYNDFYGYLNHLLLHFHLIQKPILFLVDPHYVWPSVIAANVWVEYPFVMLMFMAGLQAIDPDLYRAARADGAGRIQQFFHITLPGLQPVFFVNILLQVIFMFKTFNLVWIITQGGPGGRTELLSTLAFHLAFEGTQTGYGSAVASIIFYILLILSSVYVILASRRQQGG